MEKISSNRFRFDPQANLVLIGMPGSGKSTGGVLLAKRTARGFVDTDLLIQAAQGRSLQEIVDADGYLALREIEERVLLDLDVRNHIIATGGSAVYSGRAMAHLKRSGLAVFLDVDREVLEERVADFSTRGLAKRPEQSFAELFAERRGLYFEYADLVIRCGRLTHDEVCERIVEAVAAPEFQQP